MPEAGGSSAGPWLLLCLALLCGPGCRAQVAQAPFPSRPDTVAPGDLLGPFDGQVLDQGSGNPIGSALVVGTWSYQRLGAGDSAPPLSVQTAQALTAADGTYELPQTSLPSDPQTLLRRFTLVCYKAGYLGYRSDLRFDDRRPRHDFAQHQNKIRLERFPEGRSHAIHLAFLGGGEAVRRAAQAEAVLASLELAEARPQVPLPSPKEEKPEPPAVPAAAGLLLPDDVKALAGKGISHTTEPLPDNVGGQQPGPSYDSIHFRATGRPESFDAALRIWRPGEADAAEALWGQIRQGLGKSVQKDTSEAGRHVLRALDPKRRVRGVVALLTRPEGPPLVIEVTCGTGLCAREEQAAALLDKAIERLPAVK